MRKSFRNSIFLKHRRVLLRSFLVLLDKTVCTENCDTRPSLIPNIFRYQKVSKTQKGFSTMFFDTVRHQLFDGRLWCPLLLLFLKYFDARSFSKHRRDQLQSSSALWEERFPIEISDMPFLSIRFFGTRFFWNTEGFPTKIFGKVRQKFLKKNRDKPHLLLSKKFANSKIFRNTEVFPPEVFRHCETKKHQQRIVKSAFYP